MRAQRADADAASLRVQLDGVGCGLAAAGRLHDVADAADRDEVRAHGFLQELEQRQAGGGTGAHAATLASYGLVLGCALVRLVLALLESNGLPCPWEGRAEIRVVSIPVDESWISTAHAGQRAAGWLDGLMHGWLR